MYETKHGLTILEAVRILLPQMCSSTEAVRLVETNLKWKDKLRLRIILGQGWKPIMGALSGHYDLDFTNGKDRLAAKKLSEQATLEKRFSQFESERDDTSQTGDWENYRNGWVDGAKVYLTSSFFNKASTLGKVRFDFVCTTRPKKGALPMNESKFEKLMEQVGLRNGGFDTEPEFFAEYTGNSVIKEHWLGWQMTTRRQYELDRAYAEKERLDEIEAKKVAKVGKKGGKKGKMGEAPPAPPLNVPETPKSPTGAVLMYSPKASSAPSNSTFGSPTSPTPDAVISILNANSPSELIGGEPQEEPVPPGGEAERRLERSDGWSETTTLVLYRLPI